MTDDQDDDGGELPPDLPVLKHHFLSPKEYVAKHGLANYTKKVAKQQAATNPDGSPIGLVDAKTAVRTISRRMTAMALHTLSAICERGKNEAARVAAAREILDRGWGKSHIHAEQETRPGTSIQVVFGEQPKVTVIESQPAPSDDDDDEDDA